MPVLNSKRRRPAGLVTACALVALSGPLASGAMATPNSSGSGQCEGYGGGTPGQVVTTTVSTVLNGREVSSTTVKHICGKDGKWHTVGRASAGSATSAKATTATAAGRSAAR